MKKNLLTKITLCAILSAFATITFTIENLFPPLFIPGSRMGLSNVFILLSAILLGGKYAFCTLIIKSTLGSLFAGNVSQIIYALPAGAIALSIELAILFFIKRTSIVSISVCGAVINATLQNLTFCLITGTIEFLCYLPYLSLISIFSGLIVGLAVYLIIKHLPIESLTHNLNEHNVRENKIEN